MNELVETVGFGLVTASVVALGSVGFTLQYSVSHILNLAYGAVMTVAAYSAYMANVQWGLNIWPSVAIGAAFGAALTVLLQVAVFSPFIRRKADPFTLLIASAGVGLVLDNALNAIAGFGSDSYNVHSEIAVHVWKFVWTPRQLVIMGLAVVAMILLHATLRYTRMGKAMRAVADDTDLASSSGVNSRLIITLVWVLSGIMCGLAGVILALNTVSFNSNVGTTLLLVVIAAAIVGGAGEPYGAMIAAVVIGIASELTAWLISPGLKDIAALALLVAILILRPEGILSGERLRTEAQPA
jgi:branched-chain amino acid transport system permease protein/neutral amino acid transport system permease protein